MSTYAQWKPEIVALLNQKNNSTLTAADIELELLNQDDASVTVKVTPSVGSRYYGEETITYVRRDLAKAFLNIPLRVIVASDTTVGALLQKVADRFGVTFDKAVDFAQAELDKVVSFAESGQQDVDIPVADSSFVWVGKLTLTAANDGLDLESIIANVNILELDYLLHTEDNTTSASLQTFPVDYSGISGLSTLEVGNTLTEAQATDIVARTVLHEPVANEADLHTALNGGTVLAIAINEALSTATVSLKPQATYSGNAFLTYGKEDPSTLSAWQKTADDYGPGRAVLNFLLGQSFETDYPIMGMETDADVCAMYLDFLEPAYTPQMVPPLLKALNRIGNFGIEDSVLETIAASVVAERTTVNPVGDNVRTLTFADTQGHPEISPLQIKFKTTLNIRANSGIAGKRSVLPETPTGTNATMYMASTMSQLYGNPMPYTDATLLSTYTNVVGYLGALGNPLTNAIDFSTWTVVRRVKSDFTTPQFADKYKQQTTFYLSPARDQLAIVIEATDYADGFEYRMIDDVQVVLPIDAAATSGDRSWTGEAGENLSLPDFLVGTGDSGYYAGSLVAKVIMSTMVGVTAGSMGANRQVLISPTGYPEMLLSYTQLPAKLNDAVVAEKGSMDNFMLEIFPTVGSGEHTRNADIYTLYDRELYNEADPTVLKPEAADKLWTAICALDTYQFDPTFIKPKSISLTKGDFGAGFAITFTGLDAARWGEGYTSGGYGGVGNVRICELMQFKTFNGYNNGVLNTDWAGKAPADALGDFLAGIRDGALTQANWYDTVIEAVVGRFGVEALSYDNATPDDLTGFTASATTDVTHLLADSDYGWQKYVDKVEVTAWSKDDKILVIFKPTIKVDVSNQVVDGGLRLVLSNPYVGNNIGITEAIIDFTNNVFVNTAEVSWENFRFIAGVRLDNKTFVSDAVGNNSYLTNTNPLPGQGTAWRTGGTPA